MNSGCTAAVAQQLLKGQLVPHPTLGQQRLPATWAGVLKPAQILDLQVPEGVDWAKLVANAMAEFNVEIAGGLGPTAGKVWRVGVMG